jgi:N-acetylmuramoyl-L-alanine amidase
MSELRVKWYPAAAANYNGPWKQQPWCIVLHGTAGPYQACLNWFANPRARASAHYVIALDGRVAQCVSELRIAWHAGVSRWKGVTSCNQYAFGIEMETDLKGYSAWPPAQFDAAVEMCSRLCKRWGIGVENIVTHAMVATPKGRKVDPRDFPLAELRRRVAA